MAHSMPEQSSSRNMEPRIEAACRLRLADLVGSWHDAIVRELGETDAARAAARPG